MSNTDLIIAERSRDIGDFLVGRLLPFRKKRMVGPFIFIDHMGPSEIGPGKYMDVNQHPHIGLSTLTYLLEGEMVHRDSIGSNQRISPGSVNFMTAGNGVVHTERTPSDWRDGSTHRVHGYQIWVALPKALEQMEPNFQHLDAADLPYWEEGAANFRLIAGSGYGRTSPLAVYSDLFMIEVKCTDRYALDTKGKLEGEIGVCIVEGAITACGERIEKGNMLVSKVEDQCTMILEPGTHVFLFGGEPFPEERFIAWNFVASEQETIDLAKERWKNREFKMIEGDDTYIPWP